MSSSEGGSDTSSGEPTTVAAPQRAGGSALAPTSGALARPDGDLGATVAALTEDDIEPASRLRLLGRLVGQVRARGLGDFFKPTAANRWMTDTVTDVVPYVPIRDLATLRRHHDGLEGDALADRLVRNASRATAGIGAAGGGVASVEWVATPTLLSAPVLLAVETVAVVVIEVKLIGELHEVYRVPVPGSGAQRAVTLLRSWASQRGVNPMMPGVGVGAVLGTTARKELRDTLMRRFGRNLTTLGPFLSGAAVASFLNRRATRGLGDRIRDDLRKQRKAEGDRSRSSPDARSRTCAPIKDFLPCSRDPTATPRP